MKIAIIGGTGRLGYSLAKRLASIGKNVIIASRDIGRAHDRIKNIQKEIINTNVCVGSYQEATEKANIVFITVPYQALFSTIETILPFANGKILVDTTVPLNKRNPSKQLDSIKSVAEKVNEMLPEDAMLVSGFHTVSHLAIADLNKPIKSDVLLCGNDASSIQTIVDLTRKMKGSAFNVGGIESARVLERLTPMLIELNKQYKKKDLGIKITGI